MAINSTVAPHAGIIDFSDSGGSAATGSGAPVDPGSEGSSYLDTSVSPPVLYYFVSGAWTTVAADIPNTYETVSHNLKAYPYVLNYTGTLLTSKVWTTPAGTITKTFNRTGTQLTSMVLSGAIPLGIKTTKTLNYSGTQLSGATYS